MMKFGGKTSENSIRGYKRGMKSSGSFLFFQHPRKHHHHHQHHREYGDRVDSSMPKASSSDTGFRLQGKKFILRYEDTGAIGKEQVLERLKQCGEVVKAAVSDKMTPEGRRQLRAYLEFKGKKNLRQSSCFDWVADCSGHYAKPVGGARMALLDLLHLGGIVEFNMDVASSLFRHSSGTSRRAVTTPSAVSSDVVRAGDQSVAAAAPVVSAVPGAGPVEQGRSCCAGPSGPSVLPVSQPLGCAAFSGVSQSPLVVDLRTLAAAASSWVIVLR